jgi:flagellar motor switch protein FliM
MVTAHPLVPAANDPSTQAGIATGTGPGTSEGIAADQAMVPSPQVPSESAFQSIPARVAGLPVELDVSVPVRDFRVRNLLALTPGDLIESGWGGGEDVPLAAGKVQLTWSEFEVVDTELAVRVTRLA